MSKNTKNVAVTAEQLEVAARRFRLRSGIRAGKGGTGEGHKGGKGIEPVGIQANQA